MTTNPSADLSSPPSDLVDLDELFANAPVLRTPHDLADAEIMPDDAEFEEFLRSYREDRQRDMA